MVNFDHVHSAFKKTKSTCMAANLRIATPKLSNSDTCVCLFLAQVPPSEACFASGASQPLEARDLFQVSGNPQSCTLISGQDARNDWL
jgi:hypothetical protein